MLTARGAQVKHERGAQDNTIQSSCGDCLNLAQHVSFLDTREHDKVRCPLFFDDPFPPHHSPLNH